MRAERADTTTELGGVIADYLDLADAGRAPEAADLLARHPNLRDELAAFLAAQEVVEGVAGPLRRATAAGPHDETVDSPAGQTPHPGEGPGEEPAGVEFGEYELLEKVAEGGMGVVYRARHARLRRVVALKMILAGRDTPADRERFRVEAEAAARLSHPGIVQLFEVGEHGGRPFLAMEFCEGGSLAGRLGGRPDPPARAAATVRQIADAVHAAHLRHVVHRDLKPSNVLLTTDGRPKVADFGLAKRLDVESGLTRTDAILGSPSYMAPEQAVGGRPVGAAADVYALGAILFELLTGRPPFKADTPFETIRQVLRDDPVPPRRMNPGVPRDLETVCLKCLDKDPARRYATAEALADELGRFLRGEPIHARPVGATGRGWRWCRRNPAVAGLLAAVVLILLGGTATSSYFAVTASDRADRNGQLKRRADELAGLHKAAADDANDRERDTARNLHLAHMNLVGRAWEENNPARVRRLLDAQQPWRTGGLDLRAFEWHYWWATCNADLMTVETDHIILAMACSPDGKTYASAGGQVRLWDADTGRPLRTLEGVKGAVWAVAFSPDGKLVAAGGTDRMVRVWEVETGRPVHALAGHEDLVYGVEFSPDGRRLASSGGNYSGPNNRGEIRVWDLATGRPAWSLTGQPASYFRLTYSPDGRRLACGYGRGMVGVWDAESGRKMTQWNLGAAAVHYLAYSPDGRRIACGGAIEGIRVCDAASGKQLVRLDGFLGNVHCLAFHPDGTHLVSGGQDRTVKVWDSRSGRLVRRFLGHSGHSHAVLVRPGGRQVVSGGYDGTIKVWDFAADPDALTLPSPLPTECVAFSPDGRWLVRTEGLVRFPDRRGAAQLFDPRTGERGPRLDAHAAGVFGAAFSPDGKQLATAGGDGAVIVWDTAAWKPLHTFPKRERSFRSVAFSPDGRHLAAGTADSVVLVWDAATRQVVCTLRGGGGPFGDLAFSPDGTRLLGTDEYAFKVWAIPDGREVVSTRKRWVRAAAFSTDGKAFAIGEGVDLHDAVTGARVQAFSPHSQAVSGIAFSPDGRRVASCSIDKTVKLCDRVTGEETLTLRTGHPMACVTFNRDGTCLAAGGEGPTMVWHTTLLRDRLPAARRAP